MKTKVAKSEEKIEEEKIKMFQPRTLNKEEQLKVVFNHLLTALILEVESGEDESKLEEKYTNIFMREIKIRVKL